MADLLRVPEVAAGATEVVLSEWLVAPGDEVTAGTPIAVVETDKATVEIQAESSATLLRHLAEPGKGVDVGAPLALLGSSSEADGDVAALLSQLGVTPEGNVVHGTRDGEKTPDGAGPEAGPEVPASERTVSSVAEMHPAGRRFISPIARRLLAESGVSPADLVGSGPGGRIVRKDVDAAIATMATSGADAGAPTSLTVATPESQAAPSETVDLPGRLEPLSRVRRAIASRLVESKQSVPHFYLNRAVRLDRLLALRAEVNLGRDARISINDFILKAVGHAHMRVPDANVVWAEDHLRYFDTVDVGVAIASKRGLVTPVLRAVERSSLGSLSSQVRTLAGQANAGRLRQTDLEGGSITVTNLGHYEVDHFAAIINPPQSSILAVGAVRALPVVAGNEVVVQQVADLTLSVDHRALDGALAARWMSALVKALEDPVQLLV